MTRGRVTLNTPVVSAVTRRDTLTESVPRSQFSLYWVPTGHRGPARAGAVEETPVEVSSWDLVPVESVSKTVDIQCACGDVVNYPVAEVSMKVGDYPSQCRQLCQIGYLFLC